MAASTEDARRRSGAQEEVEEEKEERTMTNDGFTYQISDKWAHCYPGEEVAVVTMVDKPPVPPAGYVPLRLGVHHQFDDTHLMEEEDAVGFSLDTLLWNEELLESRLDELTAWTRRAPLSLRDKLDRINWLVNTK